MNEIITQFTSLVDGFKLVILFGLITIDTLMGLFMSIFNKTFQWSKITSFLNTSVISLVVGYYAVGIFAAIEPQFAFAVPTTWALINAKLIADIVNKLKSLGVPSVNS